MREKDAETDRFQAVVEPVGSRPFRFLHDEHVPGSLAAHAVHPGYVPRADPPSGYAGAKRAGVERVEWRIIPDAATQVAALKAGEVDIIGAPPPELLPQLRRDPALNVAFSDRRGWLAYVRPNHLHPPFGDVRARQALMRLVDVDDFHSRRGRDGHVRTLHGLHGLRVAHLKRRRHGTLRDARPGARAPSWPTQDTRGSPIVVLEPVDNPFLGSVAAIMTAQLRKVGVTAAPCPADLATILSLRASQEPPGSGGWHLLPGRSLAVELASPLTNFPLASPCGRSAGGDREGWSGWPCDPAIETLRAEWGDAPDDAERSRIAGQLQRRAAVSLPFIPVGQIRTPLVHRRAVTGLIDMPIPVLWNAAVRG